MLDSGLTRQILLSLFSPIGLAQFLDEKLFDVATALCGSGPAMVFLVIEAMADGAVAMGMPRKAAIQMAAQSASCLCIALADMLQRSRAPAASCLRAVIIRPRSKTRSPRLPVRRQALTTR